MDLGESVMQVQEILAVSHVSRRKLVTNNYGKFDKMPASLSVGIPNHRIFDDSKYSIFDDRISNHRIGVKYSNIEPIR